MPSVFILRFRNTFSLSFYVICSSFSFFLNSYYGKGNKQNCINYKWINRVMCVCCALCILAVWWQFLLLLLLLLRFLQCCSWQPSYKVLMMMMSAFCPYNCEKFCSVFAKLRTRSDFHCVICCKLKFVYVFCKTYHIHSNRISLANTDKRISTYQYLAFHHSLSPEINRNCKLLAKHYRVM